MANSLTALLLAGGRSHRLGQDKRFLKFKGKPLILRAYEATSALADEVWVLLAEPQDEPKIREALGARSLRFAFDPEPGAGPLGALAGVLPRVKTKFALLLAVDHPHLTGEFLKRLIEYGESQVPEAEVIVPLWQGVPQVACAFYRPSLASELGGAFQRGERSLRRFVEGLASERVLRVKEEIWHDWAEESTFVNVDTFDDYKRLLKS